jgi:antitoxin component YwqK of YwqJK toxin-antitoxin module
MGKWLNVSVLCLCIFSFGFADAQDHAFKLTGGKLRVIDFYILGGDTVYQKYEKSVLQIENGDSILAVEFFNSRKNWYLYRYKIVNGEPNLDGWQREYDLEGVLQNERYCELGERECGITNKYVYYPGGQLSSIAGYKKNTLDGYTFFYYSNGQLRQQIEYRDGKLWNILSSFDQDGNAMPIGDFKDGTGTVNVYSMNGKLIQQKQMEKGRVKKKMRVLGD